MSPPPIDRGYAWVIVLATACPQMLYVGFVKSGGILLVEIMKTFNATSSQVAITFTLCNVGNSVASLLVLTVLEPRIQKRLLAITGGLLFALGLFSGFFSTHFLHVVIPYGICSGLGMAFMYGPQVITVRQYFHHRQALAFAVAVSGASVGTAVIPILFRRLLEEYGLHGAMLVMAGIIMHCAVFGALLRPIESYKSPSQPLENGLGRSSRSFNATTNADEHPGDDDQSSWPDEMRAEGQPNTSHGEESGLLPTQDSTSRNHNIDDVTSLRVVKNCEPGNMLYHEPEESALLCSDVARSDACTLDSMDMKLVVKQNTDNEGVQCESALDIDIAKHVRDQSKDMEAKADGRGREAQIELLNSLDIATSLTSLNIRMQQKDTEDGVNRRKLLDLSLLKQPLFLAYLIFASFCHAGPLLTLLFIPPHTRDLGFDPHQMDILISVTGVGDFLGRLLLGVVAQTGVIKRHNLLAISMLIVGITQHIIRFLVVYWSLIVNLSIYSFFAGSFFMLGPLVVADFFGIKMMPNALGIALLTQGVMYASVNALCAWIRDHTGSYVMCFHLIGSLTIVGGIVLSIIPKCCTLPSRST